VSRIRLAVIFSLVAVAAAASPKAPATLRLYVLDCGVLDIPDTSPYRLTKQDLVTTKMSAPCFLVVHPKGTMMWDTGPVPDTNFKPGSATATMRYATATKSITAQLAQIGYKPTDITYLTISHFHWDHVGNGNLFAGSTWLVRQKERDIMFAEPPSPRTEPANFSALKTAKTVIVKDADYDVFGDGTVILKSAPGHSPDHQVLFLKLRKTGPLVISGDLYHYRRERERKLVPTTEFDADQTIASRAAIEAFIKQTGAQLWIQHDLPANAKLKKSPAFYE
jgi:N-acyl homoserine lactone hydrolase